MVADGLSCGTVGRGFCLRDIGAASPLGLLPTENGVVGGLSLSWKDRPDLLTESAHEPRFVIIRCRNGTLLYRLAASLEQHKEHLFYDMQCLQNYDMKRSNLQVVSH